METFLSGYCRQLDAARTVFVEDGEADCLFPDCPHAAQCPLAKKITDLSSGDTANSSNESQTP